MSAKTKPNDTTEILVVEDSPTQAEQLRYLLEQHHYTVTMAQNGEQALAFVEEHKPALVITDIVMPEMNGFELCQRIKADESGQDIPVILLTTLSNPEDVLEGLACGADSFITKPYNADYLLMHVERVLAGRTPRPGGRAGIEVEIPLTGKSRVITAHPQQMLSLLLSNYEAAVHRNTELIQAQDELRALNEHLEDLVEERTAALKKEIAERKQAEKLKETLFDIANIANSAASLEELYRSIHASIGELLPAENFYIAIYDPDKDEISFPYFVDQYDSPPSPKKTGRGLTEYVLRSRNPLLAPPEVFESLVRQGEVELVGENSVDWLGVPLQVGDKTVGVMVVQSYTETVRFGQREMDILTFVLSQVAMVVERKRAEVELQKERDFAVRIMNSMGQGLTVSDAEGKFEFINPAYARMIGYSPQELIGRHHREFAVPEDLTIQNQAWGLRLQDKPSTYEIRLQRANETTVPVSITGVPRISAGKFTGTIAVVTDLTERKQAEEQIQKQVETLTALYDLSRRLAEMEDFNAILDVLTRCAVETTHVTFARVLLLENGDLVARAVFPVRVLDQDLQAGQREPLAAHPTCQRVLEGNAPLVLQLDSPEASDSAPFFLGIAQTLCVVPLRTRERPLGLLMLGEVRDMAREPFTADKMRLARSIGDQAASTLHRALLHEETQRRLRNIQALRDIDQAITGSLDLGLTLSIVLEQVINQLRVEAADVLLLNPHTQTLEYAAGRGFRGKAIERSRLRLGEGHAGRAALERRTVSVHDLRTESNDFARADLLAGEDFDCYYSAPLIAKGQVKGVLEVFLRSHRTLDDEWLNFLETLASQVAIAVDNVGLFDSLQRSNIELHMAYDATIEGWSRALDLRDRETEGHSQRVTEMTMNIARVMGMTEEQLVHVRRGALLHDIGKMGVLDSILLKPDKLSDEEWVIMRQHPKFAFDMLSPIAHLQQAIDIPYAHHEKWDGSGYPRGLKGEQIPHAARIFAVVDVYDALTSDRPYRRAWTHEKAFSHIREQAGSHFDPEVVKVFLKEVTNEK